MQIVRVRVEDAENGGERWENADSLWQPLKNGRSGKEKKKKKK